MSPTDPQEARVVPLWRNHAAKLDDELIARAAPIFTRLVLEQFLDRAIIIDPAVADFKVAYSKVRAAGVQTATQPHQAAATSHHHGTAAKSASSPLFEPQPSLDAIQDELARSFNRQLLLWKVERDELAAFGGELDASVQMPGWTNVWTMPIQNRVDMLATGVNTPIGIRVLGRILDDVIRGSEEVARVVKPLPGAADVVADPIRGKPYIEIRLDRARAARLGVSAGEVNDLIEIALGGKIVTSTVEGRERHPVVVRFGRAWREDEESIRNLPVTARGTAQVPGASSLKRETRLIPLSEIADVTVVEGPASIKSENGLLRNYVRVNVRDRDAADLVAEAKLAVAKEAKLPDGVFVEWTGQFEHAAHARDPDLGRAGRDRDDPAGSLSDLPRLSRRGAHVAGRARSDRWRAVLPVCIATEAFGHGLGWIHRLFWYGDLNRYYHAGLFARSRGQGRRPRSHQLGRTARGGVERSRAQTPAEAVDGGNRGDRPGPDALGQRCRLGDYPADGGASVRGYSGG